jgi:hypothetical protein
VDALIETRERLTVADIFARQGEPYFRAVEREILTLLHPLRHVVVATGGGSFMDPENRAAINMDGVSVWLDVPFEEVLARIPADGRRPLAANRATGAALRAAAGRLRAGARANRGGRGPRGGSRRAYHGRAARTLMRYLILSDIHANLQALEAVLDARRLPAGTASPCSAISSATARIRTPSSIASASCRRWP